MECLVACSADQHRVPREKAVTLDWQIHVPSGASEFNQALPSWLGRAEGRVRIRVRSVALVVAGGQDDAQGRDIYRRLQKPSSQRGGIMFRTSSPMKKASRYRGRRRSARHSVALSSWFWPNSTLQPSFDPSLSALPLRSVRVKCS